MDAAPAERYTTLIIVYAAILHYRADPLRGLREACARGGVSGARGCVTGPTRIGTGTPHDPPRLRSIKSGLMVMRDKAHGVGGLCDPMPDTERLQVTSTRETHRHELLNRTVAERDRDRPDR